ncbi:MAG: hypothetical protein GX625_13395 [Clostridiaceae bacterium]|jgi:5-methylcytosine-specific restriction endonuclease McrA|nr:hypothetical protein [Clostridiaceae bacterium]
MTDNERISALVNEHRFNEGTARAYVQSSGKCVYCDKNLLNELSDFYAADIDHLLPKSKHPELESDNNNWVLSCRACNSIKGKMDIPDLPWDASTAIKDHKEEVIAMVREALQARRKAKENEFLTIRRIIQER